MVSFELKNSVELKAVLHFFLQTHLEAKTEVKAQLRKAQKHFEGILSLCHSRDANPLWRQSWRKNCKGGTKG
jgi:hypothetical protein